MPSVHSSGLSTNHRYARRICARRYSSNWLVLSLSVHRHWRQETRIRQGTLSCNVPSLHPLCTPFPLDTMLSTDDSTKHAHLQRDFVRLLHWESVMSNENARHDRTCKNKEFCEKCVLCGGTVHVHRLSVPTSSASNTQCTV